MKTEWLVINVTAVESTYLANCEIFGMILIIFWQAQAAIGVRKPLYDLEILS